MLAGYKTYVWYFCLRANVDHRWHGGARRDILMYINESTEPTRQVSEQYTSNNTHGNWVIWNCKKYLVFKRRWIHQTHCTSLISCCLAFICCIPILILSNIPYSISPTSHHAWCHRVLSVTNLVYIRSIVQCRFNAVQFIAILHKALHWQQ